MRFAVALALLAACGSAQPVANGVDRGWFCLRARDVNGGQETSACFRSRDDCSQARTGSWQLTQMCAPQPMAYCLANDQASYGSVSNCFATPEHCSSALGAPESCVAAN